jgi:hypothetical protein
MRLPIYMIYWSNKSIKKAPSKLGAFLLAGWPLFSF